METAFLVLRVAVALGVVLAIILWAKHRVLATATKNGRKVNAVNVVGRHGLAAKASVVIVEAEGQRFVLGVTEQSVNVLHQVAIEEPRQPTFEELMAQVSDTVDAGFTYDGSTVAEPAARPSVKANNFTANADNRLGGSILSPNVWKSASAFSKGLLRRP